MLYIDLKSYVDSNEYTLSEIHTQTGISRNTLNLLYKGNDVKGIQLSTLEKLIDFFGISVSDIIRKEKSKPNYTVSIAPDFKKYKEDVYTSILVFGFVLNKRPQDFSFPVFISKDKEIISIKIISPKPMIPAIIAIRSYSSLYTELLCADITCKILENVKKIIHLSEKDVIIFDFDLYNKGYMKNGIAKSLLNNPIQLKYMWQEGLFDRNYEKYIVLKYK